MYEAYAVGPQIIFGFLVFGFWIFDYVLPWPIVRRSLPSADQISDSSFLFRDA